MTPDQSRWPAWDTRVGGTRTHDRPNSSVLPVVSQRAPGAFCSPFQLAVLLGIWHLHTHILFQVERRAGGLRSTFIADYVHTVILFIAIFVFGFLMYATSEKVGSISEFYDLLQQASKTMPISGNTDKSYLAFRSVDGLVFAMDLFFSGFCTVWLDQAYWQRAIASKPQTSVKAFLLGGIAWFSVREWCSKH